MQSSLGRKEEDALVREPLNTSLLWSPNVQKNLCVPMSGGKRAVEFPGYTYLLTVEKVRTVTKKFRRTK